MCRFFESSAHFCKGLIPENKCRSSLLMTAAVERLMSLKVTHFQSIFLINFYLKRLIYVPKYGITHQTAMQQGIQDKEAFLQ